MTGPESGASRVGGQPEVAERPPCPARNEPTAPYEHPHRLHTDLSHLKSPCKEVLRLQRHSFFFVPCLPVPLFPVTVHGPSRSSSRNPLFCSQIPSHCFLSFPVERNGKICPVLDLTPT